MADLKPCPFCGRLPVTRVEVIQMGGDIDKVDFSIVCDNCGTSKTIRLRIAKTCYFADVEKAMEQAVEAWNRRAEDG